MLKTLIAVLVSIISVLGYTGDGGIIRYPNARCVRSP